MSGGHKTVRDFTWESGSIRIEPHFFVKWAIRVSLLAVGWLIIVFTIRWFVPRVFSDIPFIIGALIIYAYLTYFSFPALIRVFKRLSKEENLPYRTKTADGLLGDPINIAVVGSHSQLCAAMKAAEWVPADKLTISSAIRMVKSIVIRASYPRAPVYNLYLRGKKQDLVFQQEIDSNPNRRHHVRFWQYTDLKSADKNNIWVGAGTFDNGVGVCYRTGRMTHRIDPNVDAERDYIVYTLRRAKTIDKTKLFPASGYYYESKNGYGHRFYTDGKLTMCYLKNV